MAQPGETLEQKKEKEKIDKKKKIKQEKENEKNKDNRWWQVRAKFEANITFSYVI